MRVFGRIAFHPASSNTFAYASIGVYLQSVTRFIEYGAIRQTQNESLLRKAFRSASLCGCLKRDSFSF